MNYAGNFTNFRVRKYTLIAGIPAECLKEISTLKVLSHPHVVRLSGVHRDDECLSLLLDLPASATPLAHALSTPGRPALHRWTPQRLMKQLLSAVAYCHSHGVVHRSINPWTVVIVGDQRELKLTGFSNLHRVGAGRGEALAVQHHKAYMSPEALFCSLWPGRVLGAGADQLALEPLYRSSDVWATACILLDFLHTTGQDFSCDRTISESEMKSQYDLMVPRCGESACTSIPPWTWPSHREVWGPVDSLGDDAVSFVEAIRQYNPTLRESAVDLLDYPFLTQEYAAVVDSTSVSSPNATCLPCVDRSDVVAAAPRDVANRNSLLTPVKSFGSREAADLNVRLLTERHEVRRMEVKMAASLRLPFNMGEHEGRVAKRRPRNLIPSVAKVQKLV